ncbi:MAG: endolytic transglycosylase MltG [Anaerorhabdus sp.]
MKKSKRRLNVSNLLILILTFLLISIGIFYFYCKSQSTPITNESEIVVFSVQDGHGVKATLKNLEKENIIKSSFASGLLLKFSGKNYNLKLGDYNIDKSWDINKILSTLSDGSNAISDTRKITFIEGEWLKNMADKLSTSTNLVYEDIIFKWNDKNYVEELMKEYSFLTDEVFNDDIRYYLEGYLFPNTYEFYVNTTIDEATRKMLDETNKLYIKNKDEILNSPYSIHEIFTLASIVQYEASSIEDMKLIAGVFLNRLDINMKLQSSVTVCYALDLDSGKDWKDCESNPNHESPYNTYRYQGLPPGPILNFSEEALNAVLNPTKSEFLYFMADVYNDGKVYFAENLEEHEANVDKYLR